MFYPRFRPVEDDSFVQEITLSYSDGSTQEVVLGGVQGDVGLNFVDVNPIKETKVLP